jgi:acyl-CoA synthetase (AMP-forming)/AMP-acid ligase II/acyl carrier protein
MDGDTAGEVLSYEELDRAARAIAVGLTARFQSRSRIALVFPPGLDFIKAFFGCVYADMIPVPATYPKPRRPSARLTAIMDDARPEAILSPNRVIQSVADSPSISEIDKDLWLSIQSVEQASCELWEQPEVSADSVAFLQYTSGSTSEPRGVMVTHRNITSNLEMIREGFALRNDENNVGVSWLPAYHDMGLIGGILESIYVGGTTVLMSPLSFLQRPMRWLKTISQSNAMISGGPNFAFELCVRKFAPDELKGVDLSSWRVAFSGAEPIRAGTMRRFSETFAPFGFSEDSFYPCYGLAEATLLAAGGRGPSKLKTCTVRVRELREVGQAVRAETSQASEVATVELVSCGGQILDGEVRIVDAETHETCIEGQVGEIWVRGRNVTAGYWNREGQDGDTFRCEIVDRPDADFLRTGDLGFLLDDQLYVTGRLKQLLIIRGKNHYPHDIEATAQLSNERLIPGGGAALLIDKDGEERLVIIQEIERTTSPEDHLTMMGEMRRRITDEHDVFVHEVVLIRTNSLPRTTSGKVRYSDAEKQYLEGSLSVLNRWSIDDGKRLAQQAQSSETLAESKPLTVDFMRFPETTDSAYLAEVIQARLLSWLSLVTGTPEEDLVAIRPFAEYGLDSMSAMEMIGQLETGTGLKLSPSVAWTYPSPALLADHLSSLMTTHDDGELLAEQDEADHNDFDELLSQIEQLPEEELLKLFPSEDHVETTE